MPEPCATGIYVEEQVCVLYGVRQIACHTRHAIDVRVLSETYILLKLRCERGHDALALLERRRLQVQQPSMQSLNHYFRAECVLQHSGTIPDEIHSLSFALFIKPCRNVKSRCMSVLVKERQSF